MEVGERYYRDSGAVPFPSNVVLPALGVVGGAAAGGLYGVVSYYNPSVWLSVFATFIAGALIGGWVLLVGRWCGVRNNAFAAIVALLSGAVGVYAEWVCYLWALSEYTAFVVDPNVIWFNMRMLAAIRAWTVAGWEPNAIALYAFWIADALAVGLTAACVATMRSVPYCEECRQWMADRAGGMRFASTDVDALRGDLEAERYEVLDAIRGSAVAIDDDDCLKAEVYTCGGSCENAYLTLHQVKATYDKKGERTEATDVVLNRLRIPIDLADRLAEELDASSAFVSDGEPAFESPLATDGEPAADEPAPR